MIKSGLIFIVNDHLGALPWYRETTTCRWQASEELWRGPFQAAWGEKSDD